MRANQVIDRRGGEFDLDLREMSEDADAGKGGAASVVWPTGPVTL